jgi:hypothetical protein
VVAGASCQADRDERLTVVADPNPAIVVALCEVFDDEPIDRTPLTSEQIRETEMRLRRVAIDRALAARK